MKIIEVKNNAVDFLTVQEINKFDSRKYIPFGAENQAPQTFSLLGRTVLNHRALLNSKTRYTSGSDIFDVNGEPVINVNNNGQSLHEISKRLIFDEFDIGNAYLELVTDSKSSFLQFYHIGGTTGRLAKDLKSVFFHPTWRNVNITNDKDIVEIPIYPVFKQEGALRRSVVRISQYEPEFINGIPSWYAGLRTAVISGLIDESNKSELENSHAISGMLYVPGNLSDDEAEEVQSAVDDTMTGAKNAGKLRVGYYDGRDGAKPEMIDFRKNIEGNYINLNKLSDDKMLLIHSWYRSLAGYQDPTGFDTNRIIDEYKVALNTSIVPKQNEYLNIFNPILKQFNLPEIEYINKSPVTRFDTEDMLQVWEWREKNKMPFDKENIAQQKFMFEINK